MVRAFYVCSSRRSYTGEDTIDKATGVMIIEPRSIAIHGDCLLNLCSARVAHGFCVIGDWADVSYLCPSGVGAGHVV